MNERSSIHKRRERKFTDSLHALDRYLLNEILATACSVRNGGSRWSQGRALEKALRNPGDTRFESFLPEKSS
jgi:hypothetical protein